MFSLISSHSTFGLTMELTICVARNIFDETKKICHFLVTLLFRTQDGVSVSETEKIMANAAAFETALTHCAPGLVFLSGAQGVRASIVNALWRASAERRQGRVVCVKVGDDSL